MFDLLLWGSARESKTPRRNSREFEFRTSKGGWQVYCGSRTKVVRDNHVFSWFQKSSGHNFSGKYYLGTRIRFPNFLTKIGRKALWRTDRRSLIFFFSSLFHFLFTFSCERVRLSLFSFVQVYALINMTRVNWNEETKKWRIWPILQSNQCL